MVRYGQGPYGDARFALCNSHALEGLQAFDGGIAEIRRVQDDPHYTCFCGEQATFFILEILEDRD